MDKPDPEVPWQCAMAESGPEGVALSPAVLVCCFQGEEESARPPNGTARGGREAWFSHMTAATGHWRDGG